MKLPTTEEIELLATRDLIAAYNHFAPTAGQNPVKKFQDRPTGIKRLTALADALRAAGKTEAAPPTEWPLVAKAGGDAPTPPPAAAEVTAEPPPPVSGDVTPAPKAKPASATPKKGGRPPLAVRLRELIAQTNPVLDNNAIWAIVQPEYGLADNKKGYVAGQRRAMKK